MTPSPPSDSTPHDQKENSAYVVEHGVAATRGLLWPFSDNDGEMIDGEQVPAGVVLIGYHFKNGTENKRNMVRNTIHKSLKPPGADFVTWEDCANVRFHEVAEDAAKYRITFEADYGIAWYWSIVGKNAEKYSSPKTTMILEGLPNEFTSQKDLEEHRGHILHEFGHALGLEHEHQSLSMGDYVKLDKQAVIDHYYELEMETVKDKRDSTAREVAMDRAKARAERNVFRRIHDATNYTRSDTESIMLYEIPRKWQQKDRTTLWLGKKIHPNHKLSRLDQAFIRLVYPPDLSNPGNVQPFLQAMHAAGITTTTAGTVLTVFNQTEGSVAKKLTAVRDKFDLSMQGLPLFNPNPALSRSINPIALSRSGVNEFIGDATKNKLFRAIVRNIVYRTMVQNGIPTKVSLPGSTQYQVMKMLGALAMYDDVGHAVKCYDDQLRKQSDDRSDPHDGTLDEDHPNPDTESGADKDTPHNPGPMRPDLRMWEDTFADAVIKKAENDTEISLDAGPIHMKARLTTRKSSFDSNRDNLEVIGALHFEDIDDIPKGTKAKWTLDWVIFYHDKWDSKNFTAYFIPLSLNHGSKTSLRSENEDFENVEWQSTRARGVRGVS